MLKWPKNKNFYDIGNLMLILICRPKRVVVPSRKIDRLSRHGMCELPPSTSSCIILCNVTSTTTFWGWLSALTTFNVKVDNRQLVKTE